MKTKTFTLMVAMMLPCCLLFAQTEYFYPLKSNFNAVQTGAPELIVIPNDQSNTGEFVIRPVPASTCGSTGQAPGYFFADDAGLQFNDPAGFIDQAYSLAMNFQIDEFISPPGWVRLLSFTHTDDKGIYIKLTDPPNHGTLEFWPHGTAGTANFFAPTDFYQIILVRNASKLITVYVNGEKFAEYNDETTELFVPQEPTNYIIFFRDHPSVLADEASPGFVSSIRISNETWDTTKVQLLWSQFCSTLMGVREVTPLATRIFPNPSSNEFTLERSSGNKVSFQIVDLSGNMLTSGIASGAKTVVNIQQLKPGMYWIRINEEKGPSFLKFIKN